MSLWLSGNVVSVAATTSSTIASTTDLTVYTLTAAAAATLPSTTGQFAGLVRANRTGGQGITVVQNAATSTANVTLTAASGDAIVGPSILPPGQIAVCQSNGAGTWYTSVASTGGGADIQTNVIPITSANFLAIRSSPVTIVAAPASGKCNIVDNISFKMVTTATGYANGGALEFRYTGTGGTKVTADIAAAVVTAGAGTSFTNVRGIEASLTGTVDALVCITAASADFITGTGTAVLTVQYHVV